MAETNVSITNPKTNATSLNALEGKNITMEPGLPYKPFEHRHVARPTSTVDSIINLIKGCMGTGMMAMPSAFKNAGILLGSFGVFFAGFVVTYSVHILVKTSQRVCVDAKVPSMSFSEVCEASFQYGPKHLQGWASFMHHLADVCLSLCYVGLLMIYTVFIAASLRELVSMINPDSNLSIQTYCWIIFIPLALICQIRSLKLLVPFSAMANMGLVIVFFITVAYIVIDLPSPASRPMVTHYTTWPRFLSIAVFSMEGIGVVLPVESDMKHPEKFLGTCGVLNISMSFIVIIYATTGFLGYLKYGEETMGIITLNLPLKGWIAPMIKLIMALVVYFSFALNFYVPMGIVLKRCKINEGMRFYQIRQVVLRILVVLLIVLCAVVLPHLDIIISLVGAIFFSTCGIILPAVVETVYLWDKNRGPCNFVVWKNFFIFAVGMTTLVAGSISTFMT